MTGSAATGVTSGPRRGPQPAAARPASSRRCLVMGVVNVTPDSFSDGGAWLEAAAAVSQGWAWRPRERTSSTSAESRPAPGGGRY